jgi:hypothetical protein
MKIPCNFLFKRPRCSLTKKKKEKKASLNKRRIGHDGENEEQVDK